MPGSAHRCANPVPIEPGAVLGFLEGSSEISFKGWKREEVYGWINETPRYQRYVELPGQGSGPVRAYIEKIDTRGHQTDLLTPSIESFVADPHGINRGRGLTP
jgi:hypothetical protein